MGEPAIEGEGFVYFGPEPWEGLWRNRHQLMTRFARHNRVVYVEPRMVIRSVVQGVKEGRLSWKGFFRPLTSEQDGLTVFHSPLWLPISGKAGLGDILYAAWRWLLRRELSRKRIRQPIVWLSRPEQIEHAGRFSEKLLVYHVVDEYSEYYGMTPERKEWVRSAERDLLKKSDLAIVVSQDLYKDKAPHARKIHLIPNAVDFVKFSADYPVPADLSAIERPCIGYSGLISDRLRLDLIKTLADRHPEWHFIMLGRVDDARCESMMAALRATANVHFLGTKTVSELPAYLRNLDVCMIPYNSDRNADNCSPLKLYEYMAAGKPVVTTDFAVAREFSEVALVSRDDAEFEENVARCAARTDVEDRESRGRMIASENTWDGRVAEIGSLLRALEKSTVDGRRVHLTLNAGGEA